MPVWEFKVYVIHDREGLGFRVASWRYCFGHLGFSGSTRGGGGGGGLPQKFGVPVVRKRPILHNPQSSPEPERSKNCQNLETR